MSAPINSNPIGGTTASFYDANALARMQTLEQFPEYLAGMQTQVVYIDPNDNMFHLSGPLAGKEGVTLGEQIQGPQSMPFTQVFIEGAFQEGATIQRTNIDKRIIDLRVTIGLPGMNNLIYRTVEERWWAGQIETQPGWLGVFTRLSGWRWIQVWPYQPVGTTERKDPVAYGNNFSVWDITFVAPSPYFQKPMVYGSWTAESAGAMHFDGYYHGNIALANRGDVASNVSYVVTGAGLCELQDNDSDTLVRLPQIFATDGSVLVQTDPAQRTLVSTSEEADNVFFDVIRSSGILNFFLAGIAEAGEPIWQRGYTRFTYSVPPNSIAQLAVRHNNRKATITALMPQRFRRSR